MKYEVEQSARFRRELKTALKRGFDINKLDDIVNLLSMGVSLPPKNRDHTLDGDYTSFRECHITPDWLLIYKIINDKLVLYLFRTGTHSDLF
jgi:mRNA interferase YafQ